VALFTRLPALSTMVACREAMVMRAMDISRRGLKNKDAEGE
jgi:hypothetical protein